MILPGGSGTSFLILEGVMGSNMILFDHSVNPGILHHKYLFVDHNNTNSDPAVLTGSHNWSSAASIRNDENTIIIHDAEIVNQFYQEFHNFYNGSGGNVAIPESGAVPGFSIYPNPTTGEAFLVFPGELNGSSTLRVMDATGRCVREMDLQQVTGSQNYRANFSKLPSALYFLELATGNGSAYSKIVIGK